MTLINLALLLCTMLGLVALTLAMPRHSKHMLRRQLPAIQAKIARLTGWLLLALALALSIHQWQLGIGIVTWLGWLTLTGVVLVFCLPYWPWPPLKPHRQAPKQPSQRKVEPTNTPAAVSRFYLVTAALVVLLPLAAFTWQLASTPTKPLMRADALHATIGEECLSGTRCG